jgi:hypothetical protein
MNDTSVSLVETPAAPFTMSAADKAVSLRSLKDAGVGDMIVLTKQNGYVGLYSVKDRSTKMGRHGHTAITLVNHVTGREWAFQLTTELPDPRIALVRRVSKGINSSRKATVQAPMVIVNIKEEFGPASAGVDVAPSPTL